MPAVRALAAKHGADYHMTTFWQANVELVATLRRTAAESTCFNKGVFEALNASG